MKKDTQPRRGVSKSNVTAPATAATMRAQPEKTGSERRLDASGVTPSVSVNARYIDSRLKQFCLR